MRQTDWSFIKDSELIAMHQRMGMNKMVDELEERYGVHTSNRAVRNRLLKLGVHMVPFGVKGWRR